MAEPSKPTGSNARDQGRKTPRRSMQWYLRELAIVVCVQLVGLLIAAVGAFIGYFALPPSGLSGPHSLGTRLFGAVGTTCATLGCTAGPLVAWRRWRSWMALTLTLVIIAVCSLTAVGWAFQLSLNEPFERLWDRITFQ